MKPLILLLVLTLTFATLHGKSQKNEEDKSSEEDDKSSKEEEEEEEDDFEGVRFTNKTSNATFGFNNVTSSLVVYNSTMKSSKLELQVVLLEELDENDKNVGESDEAQAYHDIQKVEVMEWVISEPENCSISEGQSNITATCITANGTVNLINNTNVVFDAALVAEDGILDLDGEEIPVKAGNVRVSVYVENWLWCCENNSTGCEVCPVPSDDSKEDSKEEEKEPELQIGSYLHVGLGLVTPDNKIWQTAKFVFSREKMRITGAKQYGAGDGAFLLMSSQVSVYIDHYIRDLSDQ